VLVHHVDTVVHEEAVVVFVPGERFEPDFQPFDDALGAAGGQRRPDRHVGVDAVVGQVGLHRIPVPGGQGLPHPEHRTLN
jgi:hypothetical protein